METADPLSTHTITLVGTIDQPDLISIRTRLHETRRYDPSLTRIVLDCAGVTAFTPVGLIALAELIKEVRGWGAALILRRVARSIRSDIPHQLIEALLPPTLARPVGELLTASSTSSRAAIRHSQYGPSRN